MNPFDIERSLLRPVSWDDFDQMLTSHIEEARPMGLPGSYIKREMALRWLRADHYLFWNRVWLALRLVFGWNEGRL